MADGFMLWEDLRGKPVLVALQGRQAGVIEDFYYDPGTQSVNALRVNAGLRGHRILLPSAISSLDSDGVTIANAEMLIDEANAGPVYQLPTGNRLYGFNVTNESGESVGSVRGIHLGIYPPVALRISAFDLDDRGTRRVSAHEITSFEENVLTVMR
jgi:uncharacterized protein YrrD